MTARPGVRRAVLLFAAALASFFALVACSGNSRLIGTWADGADTVEFVSDGPCLLKQVGFIATTCSWRVLDDGRVVMRQTALGTSMDFVGHFDGDLLVFFDPDGKPMRPLRKVS